MPTRSKKLAAIIVAVVVVVVTLPTGYLYFTQKSLIFHAQKDTGTRPTIPYEAISVAATDGVKITAWWVPQLEPDKHPTVHYSHGNGATLSMLSHVAKIFHDYGFNALLYDYRGYGTSDTAELSEEGFSRDAQATYDWVKQKVPEKHIFIWGHSLGSSVAAKLASNNHPAGVVLEGAFPSILQMAHQRYPLLPLFDFMINDKFDTARYLAAAHPPLLFIHAVNDSIIPFAIGKALYSSVSEPKSIIPIAEIDHNGFPNVAGQYREAITALVLSWMPDLVDK